MLQRAAGCVSGLGGARAPLPLARARSFGALGALTSEVDGFAHIPRISIERFRHGSPAERAAEIATVKSAFENQGMALLGDTGVPREVVQACVERSRSFFALPRTRKEQFGSAQGLPSRSYGEVTYPRGKVYQVQQEANNAIINEWLLVRDSEKPYDRRDSYYTSDEGREFYTLEEKHLAQLQWPEEVPGLREATSEYYRHVNRLANTMYEVFALALGIDADFFTSRAQRGPLWPVTIAHYPKQEQPPPEGTMRIQPHWDRTLFALVTSLDLDEQSRGGGLQILLDRETGRAADGRTLGSAVWRNVVIEPDCFVLNVGEQMARWTNERFKHVVHRVPNPPPHAAQEATQGRVSVMAYVCPDYDAVVECLPCCLDAEHGASKYEPTWIGEMMNWGSQLPVYDKAKQDRMRRAQGLYSSQGSQTTLGAPTDVNSVVGSATP